MKKHVSSSRGSSLVELCCLLSLGLVLLLSTGDVVWIMVGYATNNSLCSRASRAASQGTPDAIRKGEPYRRAMAILKSSSNSTAGPIELPQTIEVSEEINTPLADSSIGGIISGEVTVTTEVHIHPPFILSRIWGSNGIALRSTKTYPFTWICQPV